MQAAQAPAVRPEEAEQRAMAEEAKWDTSKWIPFPHFSSRKVQLTQIPVYLLAIVMGFLFVLSTIMVNASKLPLTLLLIADAARIDRYRMALWRPLRYRYRRVAEG